MRYMWVFMLGFIAVSLVVAQNSDAPIPEGQLPAVDVSLYPTYAALMNTVLPPANRVDLAQRLSGYVPTFRSVSEPHNMGEVAPFIVIDSSQNLTSQINAELVSVGQFAYVWIEQPVNVDKQVVDDFSRRFDTLVYNQVRELWGNESNPGIDGDSRIYILFTRAMSDNADGYSTTQNTYPRDLVPNSNEHEMLTLNMNIIENQADNDHVLARSAHEFQHMVRDNMDGNESAWVDEGFSVFTEKYLGLNNNIDLAQSFMGNPNTQLNNWNNRHENYGASLLFLQYFYERFGIQGLQTLSREPADGLSGVDNVLHQLGHPGADLFFADWVLANGVQKPATGFGYREGWVGLPPAYLTANVTSYPYLNSAEINQYATHYYQFSNFGTATQLTIDLQKPTEASLLPEVPPFGPHYMYSNVGDESDTTLTRAFDLSGVGSATLRYGTWFNLETYWDYFYIMVSTDGGTRWQILPSLRTTTDNPNGNAYGAGYTGDSLGWKGDQVDLTPFAGQPILLRFEMITDEAKTNPGVALDDIAIPEIGYLTDFESDDGGWIANGWIRSDNRLPQRAWLQVVQHSGEQVAVTRYLADASGHYVLNLVPNVERVTVAVSPFALLTTVPMPYILSVSAP